MSTKYGIVKIGGNFKNAMNPTPSQTAPSPISIPLPRDPPDIAMLTKKSSANNLKTTKSHHENSHINTSMPALMCLNDVFNMQTKTTSLLLLLWLKCLLFLFSMWSLPLHNHSVLSLFLLGLGFRCSLTKSSRKVSVTDISSTY